MASSVLARHARALAMGPRSMASAGGLRPVFASPPCALRTLTSRGTGRRSAEGRPCAGLPALRGYGTAPEAPGGGAVSRLVQRIAAEARHTWAGMKLFATNVRISVKLLVKSNRGEPLSRRERLLLSRTGKDLFKMVPFSFFVILPGGEPFLFLYLKLFPSALPSTFMAESVPEVRRGRRPSRAPPPLPQALPPACPGSGDGWLKGHERPPRRQMQGNKKQNKKAQSNKKQKKIKKQKFKRHK